MRISVVIPSFNAASYLRRAVASLQETSYPNLEILVVDDGSSDGSYGLAQQLARECPGKINVLYHPGFTNRGASASRNLGIRQSTGGLICFLDADDYVFPHRFATVVPRLLSDATIDGVYGTTRMVFEEEQARANWGSGAELFGLAEDVEPDRLLEPLVRSRVWATSAIIVRRSLLDRTGLFDERFVTAEDCHLWLRMACVGKIVAGDLSRPISAYFRRQGSLYHPGWERRLTMISALADVHRWARRHAVTKERRQTLSQGVRKYVLNTVVKAREQGLPKVAWRAFGKAVTGGYPHLALYPNLLRQILALGRDALLRDRDKRQCSLAERATEVRRTNCECT
jgi:glycosyltransferase involved in cell wall biosynthesis